MQKLTTTEVREHFAETVNRVHYAGERLVIVRNDRPLVALIPYADLALLEAAEDQRLAEIAAEAKAEFIASGEAGVPWEQVQREAGQA